MSDRSFIPSLWLRLGAVIITNRCGDDLTPVVASCVDLQWNVPCNPYNGPQPGTLGAGGGSTIINVTDGWNGRVYVKRLQLSHRHQLNSTSTDSFPQMSAQGRAMATAGTPDVLVAHS